MIAIIDYGAGNIFSIKNALEYLNIEHKLTSNREDIAKADGIILPGVGAFPSAMDMIDSKGLIEVLKEEAQKKPFLGICLGMQMLFDKSYEFEEKEGLSLIKGTVKKIESENLLIPHMGWNKLDIINNCKLTEGLPSNSYVYFVHSYKAFCDKEDISATCEYGGTVTAMVNRGNVYGTQFHPEKSGEVGLRILKNFGGLL